MSIYVFLRFFGKGGRDGLAAAPCLKSHPPPPETGAGDPSQTHPRFVEIVRPAGGCGVHLRCVSQYAYWADEADWEAGPATEGSDSYIRRFSGGGRR